MYRISYTTILPLKSMFKHRLMLTYCLTNSLYMSQENEDWRYDDDFIKTTKITTWKLYFLTLNQLVNCFLKIELKPRYFRTKLYAINISLFLRRRKDSFSYDKCAFLSVDFIQFYLQFVRLYVFVFECRGEKKRQNEQKKNGLYKIFQLQCHFSRTRPFYALYIYVRFIDFNITVNG